MRYCFCGLESHDWKALDFIAVCQKVKAASYDTLVFKVADGPNWWYSENDMRAFYQLIMAQGLHPIPYVFNYGNTVGSSIALEKAVAQKVLSLFGEICLDMESGFDGKSQDALTLVSGLQGEIHVSTWANIVEHQWTTNVTALLPHVTSFWPQVYTQELDMEWFGQWRAIPDALSKAWPTYTSETFAPHNGDDTGYWYEQELLSMSNYPVNGQGLIAQFPTVTEFQPGFTEFSCGAFATAVCVYAAQNGVPFHPNVSALIAWAEAEYAKTAGDNGPGNTVGASIDDMHTYLKDSGVLHWWDIDAISSASVQSHDIAEIKAALQHGYPVIATVSEQSVFDIVLAKNPYWWGPTGNHIFVYAGIANDGNLFVIDTANVQQGDGNLQTPKTPQIQPRWYDASKLDNQWATIVKMPWLPPIPNGDPLSWPPYQAPENKNMNKQFADVWSANTVGAPANTGIYNLALTAFQNGKMSAALPVTKEFSTVDWNGNAILYQCFSNGFHAEWTAIGGHLYDNMNRGIVF